MEENALVERAEKLREGLERQREIYQVIVEINHRQGEVLSAGQTEEILQLARKKEEELARIETIEAELAELKQQWPELREQLPKPLRDGIEGELGLVHEVLRTLIEQENQGQQEIEELRKKTTHKLRKIENGRRMHQAYAPGNPQGQPRYLDRSQ